ncbi:hypothetical protein ACIHAX_29230 [Nocardia sp. NPDC051929]|uniref:hypothetical protein n=1 Tax=Nocardia sp. NPDC051929 TaxID=3364327 RepID=UPI0037C82D0F
MPAVVPGTALIANCPIVLASGYNLPIGKANECPFPTKENGLGVGWNSLALVVDDRSTLAKLDSSAASYDACKKNTRFIRSAYAPAEGDVICYVGKSVVAAVTFTKTVDIGSVQTPAEFSITIWQG